MQTGQLIFDGILILIGAAVVLYLLYRFFREVRRDYTSPQLRRAATVAEKGVTSYNGRGISGYPTHRTDYVVIFQFASGGTKTFLLDPEQYKLLRKGAQGVLVTVGERYFDFEEGAAE